MKPVQLREAYESIPFRKKIPAGQTEVRVSERIKALGTLQGIRFIFTPGQEGSLRVRPFIERKHGFLEPILTFPEGGDAFLSGDDVKLDFPVIIPVENDENVVIYADNIDAEDDYTLMVDVFIDYYGGKSRVIGGMIGGDD